MRLEDFSYDYIIENFPASFQKWYDQTESFDKLSDNRISDIETRNKIKLIVGKLRDGAYIFIEPDLDAIKTFIKNSDKIFHSNQWTANYHTAIRLKNGDPLKHVELFNQIKQSNSFAESNLGGIFAVPNYNAQFPHLYSIVKNVQDENNYPIYYPHWQAMYKWIMSKDNCSFDELCTFYRNFKSASDLNKYKAFSGAINAFHIEYLKWCLNTNEGYNKTEEARKLLKKWHFENEEFLNLIHTPMQKMDFINLDKWRLLNEPLFKSYIDCYALLDAKKEEEPAKAMMKALTKNGNLKAVTEKDYSSYYTIARELGIYYQDSSDEFHLGDLATRFNKGNLSYSDYLKYYILNTEFLINDVVVHPFEEIFSVISKAPAALDDIAKKCTKCIPASQRSDIATDKLNIFIRRAVDAGLVKKEGELYSLAKDAKLIQPAIQKSGLSKDIFTEKFVGTGKNKQENIVKEMIGRNIPPSILGGGAVPANGDNDPDGENKHPLNQILFGPPGTGKTDSTIEMSLKIIDMESAETDPLRKREDNRSIFRTQLNKNIFFVTMHPSYSYEDFVQGIKPKTSDKGELLFEAKPGIFKKISEQSFPYINSSYFPGFLMSVFEEDVRTIVDPKMNQQQLLDYIGNKCGVSGGTIKNTRDYFDNVVGNISSRVGYSDENFIANNIDKEFYVKLSKQYLRIPKNMLLNSFKNNWVDKSNVEISQEKTPSNFVLILDEINRANISKVFGELITLVEDDKRIGGANELSVTLPSGEIFGVPPNLYIIGTMNTADKSIALVDIALRRRFQFKPVYPDPSVIGNFGSVDKEAKKKFMISLNEKLRKEKGVDFQIGHAYFLKNNSLKDVINQNILPLLTEYFRNDLEKVKKLMQELGNPVDEDHYTKTGLLEHK